MNGRRGRGDAGMEANAAWWERRWAIAALALVSTFPLWFTTTPPLIDFIGHMGRYRVQLDIGHSEHLQRYWDYDWALIGNLGVDLLIVPLAALFGLEPAGWIVAALLPPLMIWGVFRAAGAVYGHVPATALAALPFVLAYPYQYGFVNFWLAAGLAFHAFATWVRLEGRPGLRAAVFLPVGVIVWLCHVYGWGILGLLVGGYELARAGRSRGWNLLTPARALASCWPLLLPLLLMAGWRDHGEGAVTLGWFRFGWKLTATLHTLREQWQPLDIGTLGMAILLLYFGARDRRTGFDARFGIAALLFLAALILLPYQLFGSAFADMRIAPFLFIAALLALKPAGEAGEAAAFGRRIALAATVVFVVRIGASAIGYAQYDADYERHLGALDHVERGARVAILNRFPCRVPWRRPRLDHLGSMMLIRREAFVNSQWDVPGAQLLRPLGAAGTDFNADPSHFVASRDCPTDLRPRLAEKIAALPRDRFDYLWVIDFDPAGLPAYPGLQRLYSDDRTILYRILEPAPAG